MLFSISLANVGVIVLRIQSNDGPSNSTKINSNGVAHPRSCHEIFVCLRLYRSLRATTAASVSLNISHPDIRVKENIAQ